MVVRVIGGDPLVARVAASTSHQAAAMAGVGQVIRPLKPGNAGGGKDPDFWCAFEDGEVKVIGDEPGNTIKDRRRPRLLYRGAKESDLPCRSRVRLVYSPCALR